MPRIVNVIAICQKIFDALQISLQIFLKAWLTLFSAITVSEKS